jgi:hypothetical protein
MNAQTKQFLAFFAAAGITAGVLTWLSVSPRRAAEPSGPSGIPHTPEHLEMSSVSKSLSEMLPSIYGVPMGDVVVVPRGEGWRVVVFGVTDEDRKGSISKTTSDFSAKNPDVGGLEVIFDSPPQ